MGFHDTIQIIFNGGIFNRLGCYSVELLKKSDYFLDFKVEVRQREGGAVNIHMFCARRPGLLLSAMRALDGLGLDVQQAVISCFNGFALDVFQAEVSFLQNHITV